jgi:hypothetical protein
MQIPHVQEKERLSFFFEYRGINVMRQPGPGTS